MVDTPRKTFPELQALSAPVVDSDVLAVYRTPGPAKRTTASVLKTYAQTGLGTMATQNANAVAITGGSITGITDLAVADGGTGSSTAADARTALAVVGSTELAATTGAAMVGAITTQTGAQARTLGDAFLDSVTNVMNFIPANLRAAIRAGTSTADLSTYVQAAIDAVGAPYFPAGRYNFNVTITRSYAGLIGEMAGNQDISGNWIAGTVFWPYDYTLPLIKIDSNAAGATLNYLTFRDWYAFGYDDGPCIKTVGTGTARRVDYVEMTRLQIYRFGTGLQLQAGGLDWVLTDVHSLHNDADGCNIDTTTGPCNGWVWIKCSFTQNGRHGLYARKTDISVEVSYAHTFIGCASEYNGTDTGEAVVRAWYFSNFDQITMIGCTGEGTAYLRSGVDCVDLEFAGTTARNFNIDGFQSISSSMAIKCGATIQHGTIKNVRWTPQASETVAIQVNSANGSPNGSEPFIVIDRHTVRGGQIDITLGVNGRYDACYTDGSGPMNAFDLDPGWSSGVNQVVDMRSSSALLVIAQTAARVYGLTFSNINPGATYAIEVFGTEPVILPASIMSNASPYSIPAGKQAIFRAGSFPYSTGLLRIISLSP